MGSTTQSLVDPSIPLHRELLERLRQDRQELDGRIANIECVIQRLESESKKAARTSNGRAHGQRRAKGENTKLVAALFDAGIAVALPMKDIVERTELSFSSVQRVLKAPDYVQGADSLWRRATAAAMNGAAKKPQVVGELP
jgi:hypothetical protein